MSGQDITQPVTPVEAVPSQAISGEPASPKLDPESLALRGAPARAIRFKRGAIIGIASVGAAGLMVTAWFALRTTNLHLGVGSSADVVTGKAAAEAVNGLPGSYADVPQLGAPLPGDLGKAVLNQQRAAMVQPAAASAGANAAQQAAMQKRQQQASELKAARQSGLLVQSGNRAESGATSATATVPAAMASPAVAASVSLDLDHDPNAQGHKVDFVGIHSAKAL